MLSHPSSQSNIEHQLHSGSIAHVSNPAHLIGPALDDILATRAGVVTRVGKH
jgi:hypothetical protein